MSASQLQRVAVRMLYDPTFVRAVYEDTERALSGVELTSDEKRSLIAADRRVWGADAMRRKRSLKALLDEFKVSSALAVAATKRLASLDAFFSSSTFHECIQHRRSMALAYADYLAALAVGDARIAAVAKLERAMAKARRGRRSTQPPGKLREDARYRLAPHVEPVLLPAGTLEVMQAVERVLFEISLAPIAALAEDGPDLSGVPELGEPDGLALTAERTGEGDDVSLAEATSSLVNLLEAAREPRSGADLIGTACALGAESAEAPGILQPLLDDRLLLLA